MLGGVVIGFKAKADDAIRDIGKLNKKLGGVDKAARGAGGGMSKWAKAATAGVAAVAGVAVVAANEFVDMAKAAYSDKQAQDKLIRTIDRVKGVSTKAAEATGDWVDRMELLTLVSDDDLRKALGRLTPVTEDLTEAQKLAALAADASVASGKPYVTVVEAMAKGAAGNTTALKKLFPQLDAGPDKVLTMKEAVDQLSGSYEGAAKAAGDNDLFGRLSTAFGQIKEALGGVALPILEEVAKWFSDKENIKGLEEWIGKLETWATTVGEDLKDKIEDFIDYLKSPEGQQAMADFTDSLQGIADTIEAIGTAIDNTSIAQLVGDLETLYNNPLRKLSTWVPSHAFGQLMDLLTHDPEEGSPGGGGGSWGTDDPGRGAATPPKNNLPPQRDGAKVVNQTFNFNNAKPEKPSASIAAAQRLARNTGRGD